MVSMQSHSDGADSARPQHSVLLRRECGLLAPEEPAGDPAATGPKTNGDDPKDTMRTAGTDRRETGTGERDRQRMTLARCETVD